MSRDFALIFRQHRAMLKPLCQARIRPAGAFRLLWLLRADRLQ